MTKASPKNLNRRPSKDGAAQTNENAIDFNPPIPDESWTFEKLIQYASGQFSQSESFAAEALQLCRKSTVTIYRAGKALSLARKKAPKGTKWTKLLDKLGIPPTTDWEARELYRLAPSEEAIAGLTRSQAKAKFNIVKPKTPAAAAQTVPSTNGLHVDDDEPAPTDAEEDDVEEDDAKLSEDDEDSAEETNDLEDASDSEDDDDLDEDQPDDEPSNDSPLAAMDHAIEWLESTADALERDGVDEESIEDFTAKIDDAERICERIRDFVPLRSVAVE